MGLRRGELVRWSDVDLNEGTLRVQQTVRRVAGQLHELDAKTEDAEAVLPMPEATWLTLFERVSLSKSSIGRQTNPSTTKLPRPALSLPLRGLPGLLFMPATVPSDMAQYFGHNGAVVTGVAKRVPHRARKS